MKKRITGLALVLVMLFAFSAWAAPRLRINTTSIPDVIKGEPVAVALDYENEDNGTLTWTVDTATQGGISFADGAFSGTAGKTGSYKFTVTASGDSVAVTRAYTIRVKAKVPGEITIDGVTDDDLDTLVGLGDNKAGLLVGTAMDDITINVAASTLPVTYTVTNLPAGIKASLGEGVTNTEADTDAAYTLKLSGTPTRAGIYNGIMITVKNSSGSSQSGPYTLRVFDKAKVTTKKITDITWGKDYSFKLSASGGLGSDYPITWDTATTDLASVGLSALSFDAETGTLFGTLASSDKENTNLQFEASKDIEKELTFKAVSPIKTDDANSVEVTLPITVKAVAPTITNKSDAQGNFDDIGFTISNTDGKIKPADGALEFECTGPGTITWSVSKLPDGFTSEDATTEEKTAFKIKVDASAMGQTVKRFPVSVTAKNGAGTDVATFYVNIDLADGDTVKIADAALPEGIHKVGDSADEPAVGASESGALPAKAKKSGRLPSNKKDGEDGEAPKGTVALTAYPGPITWSASGLPAGVKLSVDKSVSFDTRAYLVGRFTKETKKDHTYTITAANKTYGTKASITKTITVYDKPQIRTNALPQYVIGSNYNAKINVTGLDASVDVALAVSGDSTALPASRGAKFPEEEEEYYFTFDKEKMAITGMLDKFPGTKPTEANKYMLTLKATITADNPAFEDDPVTKEIPIKVKGIAPKFMTARINDFEGVGSNVDASGDKHIITLTGTQPITVTALITAADAKKLSLGEEDIVITVTDSDASGGDGNGTALPAPKKADTTPEFKITQRKNGAATELLVGYAADQGFALSGVPLTITADNGASRPVTKVYKVGVTGASPVIKNSDGVEASKDITVEVAAGSAITDVVFTASGDKPLEFSTNPKIGTEKNGLTATSSDEGLTIAGTPTAGKETSTVFTVTLTNPLTKKKVSRKVTVRGLLPPTITSTGKALAKEIEIGKAMNFKLAAKGSKTITWSIDKVAEIKALGLSFDTKTGTLKGTAKGATSNDEGLYESMDITFKAKNSAVEEWVEKTAKIGIKGKKPKMMTKTITFQILSGDTCALSGDSTLRTDILTTDKTANVQWAVYGGSTKVKPLEEIGEKVTTSTDRNLGYIDVADIVPSATGKTYATKGATLKVSADNIGTEINGNVKIIIRDPAPGFKEVTVNNTDTPLEIAANKTKAVKETVVFELEDWAMTGDTGMKWAITTKPTGKVTAAIKIGNKNKSATVTVTAAKGLSSADISARERKDGETHFKTLFSVTATNTVTNASTTYKVSVDVTPWDAGEGGEGALPAQKDALPEELAKDKELAEETAEKEEAAEEEAAAEDEEELVAGEGTVTYGRARTESGLTQAERRALSEGGYVIAAILPEITTDASGQYDLDVVSLDEAAAEGAELVWFAFPRNAESTEDDSIAEFYDEAGAEIYAVPASKKVVVSPWLEAEVTYAPVIAVKAPVAGDAKTSLDEAEAGDTVTEQAIEDAAETPEEK